MKAPDFVALACEVSARWPDADVMIDDGVVTVTVEGQYVGRIDFNTEDVIEP